MFIREMFIGKKFGMNSTPGSDNKQLLVFIMHWLTNTIDRTLKRKMRSHVDDALQNHYFSNNKQKQIIV